MVKKAKSDDELKAMCSACFRPVPVADAHVQPGYNDYLKAYVTTYRCNGCRLADLQKTRDRMASCTDLEELATGVLFFARYKVAVPGITPNDSIETVRDALLGVLDRLRSGDLRIRIDPKTAVPIDLPKLGR